jgi:hypothetical protein
MFEGGFMSPFFTQVKFGIVILAMGISSLSIAFPGTGLGAAGASGGDSGCSGVDSKVSQWCPLVKQVLSDPSTCGGKAVAELQNKQIPESDKLCPQLNQGGDKLAAFTAITLALISTESGGNANIADGDVGKLADKSATSQGLMQITPGDPFPDCPKGMNSKDPLQNIKCGTCEAFHQVAKDNKMMGDKKGLSRMYGPARDSNPAHSKLIATANKACAAVGGSGGGSSGGSAGGLTNISFPSKKSGVR